jgi:myo-inositol-1(or 4)-monophosphatase
LDRLARHLARRRGGDPAGFGGILPDVLTEQDLRAPTRAALAALRRIRPYVQTRSGAADVTEKAPNDIVTATDVLVQNEIEKVLREHDPEIAFVGEEATRTLVYNASRMWLVDPICGTGNYAAALPLFATNIALVEDGQIVAACMADGGTGDIFVAEAGRGAWRVNAAGLEPVHADATYKMLSVDPDLFGGDGVARFPALFAIKAIEERRWDVRALGSTIALLYVATGRLAAAVYAPFGRAALHVAAGALLAREAGARVTDHTGAEWTIDSPILVVGATDTLHERLQGLVAEVYAQLTT